ncbi:MAG: hypothetical protein A2087_06215 [Spirochaetes bacterium GWD1_61_31]|nr:MAG: hypothetical protein A2Y37_01150 [Spirochaetes bacterium GWB1_60_80]OHD35229.1 MAG: hypothetical protein A2004_11305 [Spirochaetes bacterium GWC1_61_12]OHD41800.1 MAG: hypothetical protein A2087_06215 [Spirochaetes bacterium GWD1_61_31]OHD42604.1 MAG: hypothetical protein A2Y35_07735 [Spirochaetes bacterium GWE1_60_18]OHD59836.1 MAG: hypothetical protein A2Y32_01500 [Spirochaetes bacterium GWF1_60_12]
MTIKENLPQPDIRERLREAGSPAVSDHELLAAILGTGIRGKDVRSLASEILAVNNFSAAIPSVKDLIKTSGLGHAGACRIIAALELGRRFYGTRGRRVLNPQDAWQLVRHHADCRREHFIGCTLNGAHDLIAVRVITTGLINKTIIHPREVFADAVADRACAILVAHNHPSGRLEASVEDLEITNRLQEAGELLGIPLLDHLIFSEHNFVSLVEAGVIKRGGICNSP